jgi:hypothetical protein
MILDHFVGRDIDQLKRDQCALFEALKLAGAELIQGRTVRCPFCDDHRPSGGIYQGQDQVWRYKCQKCGKCGSVIDVLAWADGITPIEVFRRFGGAARGQGGSTARQGQSSEVGCKVYPSIEDLRKALPGPVELEHTYSDPSGQRVLMKVFRCRVNGEKDYRPFHPVSGGWVMKAPAKFWPLYNLPQVAKADTIIVTEGEKKADALAQYGFVPTTSPGGAKNAINADWSPLAGKNLILWPDRDEPGEKYMADVERICQGLQPAPRIALIDPSDLELVEKEDAFDFIEMWKHIDPDPAKVTAAIQGALQKAMPRSIAAGVVEMIERTIAGQRVAVATPWRALNGLTHALLEGTVTLLCGGVGASKSFAVLQLTAYLSDQDVKAAVFELEEDRDFHLLRALAQLTGLPGLTDPEWIKGNADQARQAWRAHQDILEAVGRSIWVSPDSQPTLDQVAGWVEDRARTGYRVIVIDPITAAAHVKKDNWEEDNAFLQRVKRAAVEHVCSVVLVTHPIKTVSSPDVNQLSGGACYSRFSQTILWLENHDSKQSLVHGPGVTIRETYNRTVHLLKTRNGKGQGLRLAFEFDSGSLTLKERGVIVKERKPQKVALASGWGEDSDGKDSTI